MALTVRFPNGQAITYNGAYFLFRVGDSWELYEGVAKKRWIASVQASSGAIIEACDPCRIENPIAEVTLEKAAELLAKDGAMESLKGWRSACHLADIKAALRKFNQQRKAWM